MGKGTKLADAYVQIIPVSEGMMDELKKLFKDLPEVGDEEGEKTGEKLGSGLKKAFLAAGVATAIGSVIKGAFSEGAQLEQSLGGVETLFKNSSDKVVANAEKAYKTAGLSANEYMENVTSFSASLLSSLAGDTEKSADVADMAMVDMADNANKFGTDMQSIQNAYQGFAKQNYTMLDNLKLGYGGTKTEMQRLLQDAEKISGVKYDISNLSDVYNAIHDIQGSLDVTGTTAEEASSTFSGSFASMKSAAKNLLGTLTTGGDAGQALDELVETSETFGDNVLRMLGSMGTAVEGLFDSALEKLGMSEQGVEALKIGLDALVITAGAYVTIMTLSKVAETINLASIATTILTLKNKALNQVLKVQGSLVAQAAGAIGATVIIGEMLASLADKATDEIDATDVGIHNLTDDTKQFKKQVDKTTDGVDELHNKIKDNTDSTQAQAKEFKTLKDRLYELNDVENKSTAEKAEMQTIVEQLNGDIDGLNLAIDSQTGSLKNNTDIVDKMVESYSAMAEGTGLQDDLATATQNVKDAETEYAEALERRNKAKADGVDANSDEMLALNESVLSLHGAVETANTDLDAVKSKITDASTAQDEFSKGFGDMSQYMANLSDDTLTSINGICEKYQEAYQTQHDLVFGQMDLLDEFCGKSDVTKETLQTNLQSNIDGFSGWESNLSTLKGKVQAGVISQEFYDNLEQMGPKGAGYVSAFVSMSDTELKEYSKNSEGLFDDMNKYVDESMEGMKLSSSELLDDLIDLPGDNANDLKVAYEMLGNYATEGYAEGIKNGTDGINEAVRTAIQDAIDTAAQTQDSHSPSRIFKKLGGYVGEGYALGIEDEADKAQNSAKEMVKNAIDGANSINDKLAVSAIRQEASQPQGIPTMSNGLKSAIIEALAEFNSVGKSESKQPAIIQLQVERKTLSKLVIDDINDATRRNGKSPIA